ncbi:MAG: YjgN family protein [Pseudomonadota bacterium]
MDMQRSGQGHQAFVFTGQGGEYFRIWIVNLALTLLTLGIYSAWAKVRRLQYFYRNTSLAGASFDYHGDPMSILKGRLIAVGLLVTYNLSSGLSPILGLVVLALLMGVFPWLLQRSLRFRLANSSYRGLRFTFDGTPGGAYKAFLLWPALGSLTLGLLTPLAHQRIKAYQHGNSRYGMSCFGFNGTPGGFYAIYGQMVVLLLIPVLLFVLLGGMSLFAGFGDPYMSQNAKMAMIGMMVLAILAFYLVAFLLVGPWFMARMQNLVWNATVLGPHGFTSQVQARRLLFIYLTNFLGILLTLGLYKPFADIRLAKYRLEQMALVPEGSLEDFIADQTQAVGATGEETAEIFDLDISF